MNENHPTETVELGAGSRSSFLEDREPPHPPQTPGLLPVPPAVEEEIARQEARHPMTLEYKKVLRDRLTLEYFFPDVEVAFRRTPAGIYVLAAGHTAISQFRTTATADQRQGVVYGVG